MSWAASCPEQAAAWPSLGQEGVSSGQRDLTGGGISLPIPAAVGWGPQGVCTRNTSLDRAPWPVAVTAAELWATWNCSQLGDAQQMPSSPNAPAGNLGRNGGSLDAASWLGGTL